MTRSDTSLPARWQQCAGCAHRLEELDPRTACPRCGGLLDVLYHAPAGLGTDVRGKFEDRVALSGPAHATSGVWRYAELVAGISPADITSFPEGNTPLLDAPGLAAWVGSDELLLKHEGMNPTGSFKDRGMTVGVSQARRVRARAVACASTGNTSASLAAYASLAGLPSLVLVPAGRIASGKLQQTLAYGARALAVRGDFDACLSLLRDAAERLGVYLLNSINPFRIEGQKTIVFELLQQLRWQAPDWIALPAGNLGNTAAFGKALDEALRLGLIDRVPRLLAVQASGAAPFHRAFQTDFRERFAVRAETVASAIRIGDPASYDRGVKAIRGTAGAVVAVDDAEILEAQRRAGVAGIGCEPASAASIAGVRAAVAGDLIRAEERVVAVLTGHLLKDPGPDRAARVPEVDATLDAVERALLAVE